MLEGSLTLLDKEEEATDADGAEKCSHAADRGFSSRSQEGSARNIWTGIPEFMYVSTDRRFMKHFREVRKEAMELLHSIFLQISFPERETAWKSSQTVEKSLIKIYDHEITEEIKQ